MNVSYQTLRRYFDDLITLDPKQRRERLEQLTQTEPGLAKELQSLLTSDDGQSFEQNFAHSAAVEIESLETDYWHGRKIGEFHIVRVLGTGGMSQVFLAERKVDGVMQQVAIKLHAHVTPSWQKRFLNERQIVASLQHPNIAHFIETGVTDQGATYFAMEFVDGMPINEYASSQSLSFDERLRLILDVAAALTYAHQQLVVHRDIKPSNVFVDKKGRVKLLDFGIAKVLDETDSLTMTSDRAYTKLYAAPEQLLGQRATVQTDVYAIAQLCYELLIGQAPFARFASEPGALDRAILNMPPASIVDCRAEIKLSKGRALELDGILQQGLRKETNKRYASVDKIAEDIRAFLQSRPVQARRTSGLYRFSKLIARNRMTSSLAALSVVLIVGAGISTHVQNQQIRSERDRAEVSLQILQEAISAADPMGAEAGKNSIRDVLDRSFEAATRIEKTQPEAFRTIAYNIGKMQFDIRQNEKAYKILSSVVATETDPKLKERFRALAFRALAATAREEDALKEYEAIKQAGFGENPEVLVSYAQLLNIRKDPAAMATAVRALSKVDPSTQGETWLRASMEVCRALRLQGDELAAKQKLDAMGQQSIALFAQKPELLVQAKNFRVLELRQLDLLDEAIKEGVQLLEFSEKLFGNHSVLYARSAASLAATLNSAEKYELSIPKMKTALIGFEQNLGLLSRTTIEARFNLAQISSYVTGKTEDALFQQSIRDAETAEYFRSAAFFRTQYAEQLKSHQKFDDALEVLLGGLSTEHFSNSPKAEKESLAQQAIDIIEKSSCQSAPNTWKQICSDSTCPSVQSFCRLKADKAWTNSSY
jgi:eukaryotic-like serine/threonine-protein kinase